MRVRALSTIKSHPYYLSQSDIITVPDEVGARWVQRGWAEQVGQAETAAIAGGPVGQGESSVVAPRDAVHHGGAE